MLRKFVPLVLLGLILVPDWASAFGRRGPGLFGRRAVCPQPVMYYAPPACPPPVVYYAPYSVPLAPPTTLAAPTVTPEVTKPAMAKPEAVKPEMAKPIPAKPDVPKIDVPKVGPGGSGVGVPMVPGDVRPAGGDLPSPRPLPAAGFTEPASPKIDPPMVPTTPTPTTPELPKIPGGFDLVPSVTPAVPNPAVPAPAVPVVPPLNLPMAEKAPAPAPVIPIIPSISKASPLANEPKVDIYVVDGAPPASPTATRKVSFYNHSDRDYKLTVGAETVTLPAKHQITAEVASTFTWKLGDSLLRTTEVPTAAPGLDLVIRK